MFKLHYIWLQWVTYGYTELHIVTMGYMWFQMVSLGYLRLHVVTEGYIWLNLITEGYVMVKLGYMHWFLLFTYAWLHWVT